MTIVSRDRSGNPTFVTIERGQPQDGASQNEAAGGRLTRVVISREFLIALVGLGVVLRVAQYASNRSLWLDEALMAINLMDKSLEGLTGALDYNQGAPIGFLFVEHFAASGLGFSEYVLRLFPLVVGIISLLAFAALAKRVLLPFAVPLAVFLFAIADQVIYYASEVKPYSSDVAATVVLLLLGVLLKQRSPTLGRRVAAGAIGAFCVLNSNPGVFTAAAVLVVLATEALASAKWAELRSDLTTISLWMAATIGAIVFATTRFTHVRESFQGGSGTFIGTSNSGSWSNLHWVSQLGTEIATAIGFSQREPYTQIEKLAAAIALIGVVSLFVRARKHCAMLVLPFGLMLAASALNQYPLSLRTTLFLVPLVILFVAEGLVRVVVSIRPPLANVAAFCLITLVVAFPSWAAARHLVQPRTREEIKPVMQFVRERWRAGDTLYIHPGAQYALRYYLRCGCFRTMTRGDGGPFRPLKYAPGGVKQHSAALLSESSNVVVGHYHGTDLRGYLVDLGKLRGKARVWVLTSHADSNAEKTFLNRDVPNYLDSIGKRLAKADAPGARIYLYNLRRTGR